MAFVPYDDEARRFINDTDGIDIGGSIAVPEGLSFDVSADDFRLLEDRRDGAALVAEALATGHAVSQFREYMRLFERALPSALTTSYDLDGLPVTVELQLLRR